MQILNYQDIIGKNNQIAEFDLYCPSINIPMKNGKFLVIDMTYYHLKVMRSKKGHLFVTFPSKATKLEDGTFKFHPHLAISEHNNPDFQKVVKELLRDFLPLSHI